MGNDVFISYASADFAIAEEVNRHLRECGFSVWFDKARLKPGYDWHAEIEKGCEESRIVLAVLTPRWKQSQWTRYETYGHDVVIPLIIDGSWAEIGTPPLGRFQHAAINLDVHGISNWSALAKAIRDHLASPAMQKAQRIVDIPIPHNPFFVGREAQMLQIHETLHQNPTTALTQGKAHALTALGGVGKTTLAREYVEIFWRIYRQIFWVDCRLGVVSGMAKIFDHLFPDRASLFKDPEKAKFAKDELNKTDMRLLVLDNAEDESSIQEWIPNGGGCRTIITSRFADWSVGVAKLEMDVLEPQPAREFLKKRTGRTVDGNELAACDELARDLGYLPLALEQAGAYLVNNTQYSFAAYLNLYRRIQMELLGEHVLGSTKYPDPVATTWKVTIEKLSAPARAVLRMASFLADTPIPLGLWRQGVQPIKNLAPQFPTAASGSQSADPEKFVNDIANELHRYSMARQDGDSIQFHNLVQAVENYNIPNEQIGAVREGIWAEFRAFAPSPAHEYQNWPGWSLLYPHASRLASDVHATPEDRSWALAEAAGYLFFALAAYATAEPLAREALAIRRHTLPQHPHIAMSLNNLALLLKAQGKLTEAEPLLREVLAIHHALPSGHPDTATGLHNLGSLLMSQGKPAEAEPLLREALDIRRRMLPAGHPDTASSLNNLATLFKEQGRLAEAEPLLREALGIRRRALSAGHPDIASSLNSLALLFKELGKLAEAELLLREALGIHRLAFPSGHPDIADSLSNLACLLQDRGNLAEAEPLYREALDIRRHALPANHSDTASSLNNLASLLQAMGMLTNAEPLYREALEIHRHSLPAKHPDIASSLNNLATLLQAQGRLHEAEPLFCEALDIRRNVLPAKHPHVAITLNNLALLYGKQGKFTEAEPLLREALDIRRHALPVGHPHIAAGLSNLAILFADIGKPADAEPLLLEAMDILRHSLPTGHPDIATGLNNLGVLLKRQRKLAEAEPLLREALDIRRRALPPKHPDLAASLVNLATLFRAQGKMDEAEPLLRKALDILRYALPSGHPDIASTLNDLASLLQDQGKLEEAQGIVLRGIKSIRKSAPPEES